MKPLVTASITFIVAFFIAFFVVNSMTRANASEAYETAESVTLHPILLPICDEEDGTVTSGGFEVPACYWDAQRDGNGTGTSFLVIRK